MLTFRTRFLAGLALVLLVITTGSGSLLDAINAPAAQLGGAHRVVLTVGAAQWTAGDFQRLLAALPPNERQQARNNPRAFAMRLADLTALAQVAEVERLGSTPGFKLRLQMVRNELLESLLVRQLSRHFTPSPVEVEHYYTSHQQIFGEARVRQILIATKGNPGVASDLTDAQALAKANQIAKELRAGGNFAALAKADSDDHYSRARGGRLGWVHWGGMYPTVDQALFSIPLNQPSRPIKSIFGYHIVEVSARRTAPLTPALRAAIAAHMVKELVQSRIGELIGAAHIHLEPSYFGAAAAESVAAAPQKREP